MSARSPLTVFAGTGRASRQAGAGAALAVWRDSRPRCRIVAAPPAACWPFLCPTVPPLPDGPIAVVAADIHDAFVNRQTSGTRLVTTQAAYLLDAWAEALQAHGDAVLIATADADTLREHAPEVVARRGPFGGAVVRVPDAVTDDPRVASDPAGAPAASGEWDEAATDDAARALSAAFRIGDAGERLRLCIEALDRSRTAPALVATASTCMEVGDLDAASRDLAEAAALAPDWAAVHYETGKLRLRRGDMDRAAAGFREATRLMPRFAPAWANLGAALGEIDRPGEAVSAFERALAIDPESPQAWNNLGVVAREAGRLADSEEACRRAAALAPDLASCRYNLGHTLFLQGRYQAALSAYVEGRQRDPGRNAVQASRLAVCRLATGDAEGAIRDLRQTLSGLSRAHGRQVAADADAVVWALVSARPDLAGWMPVHDYLVRAQRGEA